MVRMLKLLLKPVISYLVFCSFEWGCNNERGVNSILIETKYGNLELVYEDEIKTIEEITK